MIKYGFWNAIQTGPDTYDRTYDQEDIAQCFAGIIKTGVAWDTPDITQSGMNVVIPVIYANINGFWFLNDEPLNIPITLFKTGHNSSIIRWDKAERQISIETITGRTSRYVPQRDANIYELVLYDAVVAGGITDFISLVGENYWCPYSMVNAQSSTEFPVVNTVELVKEATDPNSVVGALALKEYLTTDDIQLAPTAIDDDTATWVSEEYIGSEDDRYLASIYCEDPAMNIVEKTVSGDTLTVVFDSSVTGLHLVLGLKKEV